MTVLRLLARGFTRPALTILGASTVLLVGCSTTPIAPAATVLVPPTVAPAIAPTPASAPASAASSYPAINTVISQSDWVNDPYARRRSVMNHKWRDGEALLQGYLGVNSVQDMTRTGGNTEDIEAGSGSISQYPVIGGGAQWKMGGKRIDYGIEGLMSLGGRANGGAFVVGGSGGAAIAVSLDLLIVDFYGGPFVSVPLGKKTRLYGGAGPVIQFGSYHQSSILPEFSGSSSGFGFGYYTRAGFEMEMAPGSFIGVGFRWIDSKIDLSSGFGDLNIETIEAMLTFSIMG